VVCKCWGIRLSGGVDNALPTDRPLLLFDGACGLCQALVRFVLKRDRSGRIHVASLQSETGQSMLKRIGLPTDDFDSMVFFPDEGGTTYHLRTDGVVAVLRFLPGPWRQVGAMLALLPRGMRDAGYRMVARTRHRLFGDPRPGGLDRPEWVGRVLV